MPFSLELTTHVFTKTVNGGMQRVAVKDDGNLEQIRRIREHLSKIAKEFSQRDFSGSERIHDKEMPGLAELRSARASELSVNYAELPNGARIDYLSDKPASNRSGSRMVRCPARRSCTPCRFGA